MRSGKFVLFVMGWNEEFVEEKREENIGNSWEGKKEKNEKKEKCF